MDKVLIVDDNLEVLESLKDGLSIYESQFKIRTATDGEIAIEMLKTEKISLVVTDLMMPRVGGLQLIAYMTKNHPAIPCVVMTGYGTADIRDDLLQGGVLRYIEKPFNLRELAAAIIDGLDLLDEGASLRGISVSSYLPLIEMEQITCLLQLQFGSNDRGLIYFENGILFDASCKGKKPEEAVLEMLGWEKVEITFLNLPKRKIEQRIFSDLMTLIEESKRRRESQESAIDKTPKEPPADGETETEKEDDFEEIEIQDQLETEVIIDQDQGIGDIEEERFVEIIPDHKGSVEEKLDKFAAIKGFVGIALYSIGGELLASRTEQPLKLDKVGDFVFDMFKNAKSTLKNLELGECDIIDITTAAGEHILVRSYTSEQMNFLVVLICEGQAEVGLFRHRLGLTVPSLVKDLKLR